MHHRRITLTSLPLLQRQQPIWHLCLTRRNSRSRWCMQMMLFCHGGAKRCLEEVKIAPTYPTFLAPIGHGVMLSWHNSISQPHPALKPYEQRVQTMNKLIHKIHFGATMQPLFPSLKSHLSQVVISTLLFLYSLCCISSLGKGAYGKYRQWRKNCHMKKIQKVLIYPNLQ